MKPMDCRLIVFAKAPVPGKVKTRLMPPLGADEAARLYEQMVLHSLAIAVEAHVGPVDLWCAPSIEHPFFAHCAREFKIVLHNQAEGDLGEKMAHAFQETLKVSRFALLMGTDCPALTGADLREAATILSLGADAVVGPSEDGGYVLIGLGRYAPELFTDISWGTDVVLAKTRGRLQRLGWQWYELPGFWDVDRPEDLERLFRKGCADSLSPYLIRSQRK